jgi:hypothetical protein
MPFGHALRGGSYGTSIFHFASKTLSSIAVSWLHRKRRQRKLTRREKLLKLLAEEVANEPPPRKN